MRIKIIFNELHGNQQNQTKPSQAAASFPADDQMALRICVNNIVYFGCTTSSTTHPVQMHRTGRFCTTSARSDYYSLIFSVFRWLERASPSTEISPKMHIVGIDQQRTALCMCMCVCGSATFSKLQPQSTLHYAGIRFVWFISNCQL